MNNITNLEGALEILEGMRKMAKTDLTTVENERRMGFNDCILVMKDLVTQVWQASRSQAIEEVNKIINDLTKYAETQPSSSEFGAMQNALLIQFINAYNQAITDLITKLSELKTKE